MTDTRTIIKMTEGTEEDKMFEGAFNSVLHMDKKDYPAYIGGLKVASGHEFVVSSPIDDTIRFGQFQEPEDDLPDKAVEAAMKAFGEWSKLSMEQRAGFFEMVMDSVMKQRYRLAAAVMLNSGMIRSRAIQEVDMLIDILKRETKKARNGLKGKPLGVWAIISEHNSPLAAPIGYAAAAMLAGNTVVMMPSRFAPIPVYMLYDLMKAAMLPDGVLNVIVDRRGKATNILTENEDISGIVAIGSGKRMEEMMFIQMDENVRFVNEVKGMNPILVHRPHNMTQAAATIVDDAFSYSGQDISAPSKVVVLVDEQKQFMESMLKIASSIHVGDPAEHATTVGPIISEDQVTEFLKIVDEVKDNVIFGGTVVKNAETEAGFYVKPAIVMGLPMDHELNNIDHGLPILSIEIAKDVDEALELVNGCDMGRISGIYTKDEKLAERFKTEAMSDLSYVNDPASIPKCALKAEIEQFFK